MRNYSLRIFASLLLLILSVPLFYSTILQAHQLVIRWSLHERFEKEALETFTLSSNNIVWVKHNKEIRVNNRLFDVKSISCENDKCVVTGIFDDKEDEIINKIHTSETSKKNKAQNALSQLVSIILSPCVCQSFTFQPHEINLQKKFIDKSLELTAGHYYVLTPPPKQSLQFS